MNTTKIGFVTGYTGGILQLLGSAVRELNEQGYPIEVQARYQAAEIDDEFWGWLKNEADAIVLYVNASDESFEIIKETVAEVTVPVFSMGGETQLSNVPLDVLASAQQYYLYGGAANIENFLLYISQYCGNIKVELSPSQELPWHGIYHPDAPTIFESLDDYVKWYPKKGKHTAGILFQRSGWLEGNTSVYDAVIREFEQKGVNVVPVFSHGFENIDAGIEGNDAVLSRYFIKDEKPMIDILVNFQMFFLIPRVIKGWSEHSTDGVEILKRLNVPVIQAVTSYYRTEKEWRESEDGLHPTGIVMNIAMPEFDGTIEPTITGAVEKVDEPTVGGVYNKHVPVAEQVEFMVSRCTQWLHLKDIPNSERKAAIILLNSPCKGVEATVGTAFGLDSLESVARLLHRMRDEGYDLGDNIPENGEDLIHEILEKKAISEFRWTPLSEIVKKGGSFMLPRDKYIGWFSEFPDRIQRDLIETWGDPRSDFSDKGKAALSEPDLKEWEWTKLSMGLYDDDIVIPGLKFGNVFITIQPKRGCAGAKCDGEVCKILHDPLCPPPHQWLAVYKWIEHEFGADVIVHFGTHGLLEFLPGKVVGLSTECYPQISIGSMPHLYIYNIINPMEAIIAKRRGYATMVDHLLPVMAPSGLYEGLEDLSDLLSEYGKAKSTNDSARLHSIFHLIVDKAKEVNLIKDDQMQSHPGAEDRDGVVDDLHGQLTLLRETQIRDGMHILGKAPTGRDLANLLVSILRFDVGDYTSIRRCILECMGLSYEDIVEKPAALNESGKTNGELLDESTDIAVKIMEQVISRIENTPGDDEILEICRESIENIEDQDKLKELIKVVRFGMSLIPKIIQGTENEINNLLRGFESNYIEPGPSGALTRGKVDILPTGRNMYAIDTMKIPTRAAWNVGIRLADVLLENYMEIEGRYPENIGFVLWSADAFRADGEETAQILYLMGTRPVWQQNGTVKSVEVIPLKELGRPRIDCTVRVGGILRDACPNIMELIDDAAQKIAVLDEPAEMNYVRKHTIEKMKRLLEDYDEQTAQRMATYRVFGTKPGAYGSGVTLAVFASAWKEDSDLADVYIDWSGYAYGKGVFGEANHTEFVDLLKTVDITYFKKESDEYDILDCCCNFGHHGGFTVAAKSISGKDVAIYYGDTRDPDRPAVRDLKDEIERVVRTRLLNPKWIEGKKRHGYKGAGDISKRTDHVYGWSATTKLVENWVFDAIAETFVTDEEMREWFKENNPYALEEMARRLMEAAERELWEPDEELLDKLKEAYLDIEGMMEEKLGVVEGEYQGGEITVLAREDVEAWDTKVKELETKWKKVVSPER
ncbi:MAG: cobaltochelatase subunit CobN [Methanotrichaceae archaeon]